MQVIFLKVFIITLSLWFLNAVLKVYPLNLTLILVIKLMVIVYFQPAISLLIILVIQVVPFNFKFNFYLLNNMIEKR